MTDAPPTITLKNKEVYSSINALQLLDKVDDKGKPAYKFPSPKFRLAMSKRLKRLIDARQDVEELRQKMQKEMKLRGDGSDDKDVLADFTAKMNEIFSEPETFTMAKLTMSGLDLDKNDIPLGVLADLEWLFEDDVSDKDA